MDIRQFHDYFLCDYTFQGPNVYLIENELCLVSYHGPDNKSNHTAVKCQLKLTHQGVKIRFLTLGELRTIYLPICR